MKVREKRRSIRPWLFAGVGLATVTGTVGLRRFLYRTTVRRLAELDRLTSEKTPTQEGLPFEEIWFKSRDGLKLHGWFIPAAGDEAQGKATIIMGHGHGGSKVADLHYAAFFRRGGYSVFMLDFRGHGLSEGPRGTSMGYYERYDVAGAVDWLLGRGLNRLGMFGISMGAAIAVLAAAENPHIQAIVLDSAYGYLSRSIAAELNKMWGCPLWLGRAMGWYGYRLLAAHHGFSPRLGHPANEIAKISPRPIFIIHAQEDRLTRIENAHILYKKASQPKELWIQPGIGHVEGYGKYGAEYERRVLDFLNRVNWQAIAAPTVPTQTMDGRLITSQP